MHIGNGEIQYRFHHQLSIEEKKSFSDGLFEIYKDTYIRFNDLSEFDTLCKCNQSHRYNTGMPFTHFNVTYKIHHIQWMNYLNNQETFLFVSLASFRYIWILVVWVMGFGYLGEKNRHFTDWDFIIFYFVLICINAAAISLSLSLHCFWVLCVYSFFFLHSLVYWLKPPNELNYEDKITI